MKTFFGGVFIPQADLEEAGIEYPIKLEYFKTLSEENVESKFGIEVVKKEYLQGKINVETKEVNNITNDEFEQNRILTLLKNNIVTPICVLDALQELL